MSEKNSIKTTHTIFEIIKEIKINDGVTLTELSERLDKPPSTLHTHLQTLVSTEYIVQDGSEYRISFRFLELGAYRRENMRIYKVAKSEINHLAEKTGEHANLLVEENGMGVFLYKHVGEEGVEDDTYPGKRTHLHTTSLGKVILAHMENEAVDNIIDRHGLPEITEHTITDKETLSEELAAIRERGYAIDDEERNAGMRCIGVPILVNANNPIGAISVSAPKKRMWGERYEEEIPHLLQGTANAIEVNLEHHTWRT